jgi:hypothetical protein
MVQKARKHQINASKARVQTSHGRMSGSEQQRILREHGWIISKEFRFHPLRKPVDPTFAPYYERILDGDPRAVLDYLDTNVPRKQLDASFYEVVGRLETMRFYSVANQILKDIERRGVIGWPTKRDSYRRWYAAILPFCQRARDFIRKAYRVSPPENREALWQSYVFQPLPDVRFISFRGQPNEDSLQKEENAQHQQARRNTIEELLTWSESLQKPSLIDAVQKFSPWGFVPKEVFFDLAQTQIRLGRRVFSWRPAQIARRCACRIVDISESTASHRNVRKRIA